jgi:hypothetical protein
VGDLSDEKIVLQQNLLNARTSLQETTARLEREMNVCAEALEATKQTLRESTEKLDEEKLLRAEEVKAAEQKISLLTATLEEEIATLAADLMTFRKSHGETVERWERENEMLTETLSKTKINVCASWATHGANAVAD